LACDECRDGEFITLFHAAIDVDDMTLTYCNCGHEPAVLIREGQTTDLEKGGLVLGVDPQAEYEVETVKLREGDYLLFFTDGLIDAANFEGELWGKERMLEAAKKFTSDSARQMIQDVLGYRRRFVGLARQIDDTSMIVVRVVKR
jgi:sigma-B regulation protein RsbU (phosphoserine phosphatase)